jgi:hypothetical protein
MFNKNLNNNWLASSEDKTGKKNKKTNLVWFAIKLLIRFGYYICKILEFFSQESSR